MEVAVGQPIGRLKFVLSSCLRLRLTNRWPVPQEPYRQEPFLVDEDKIGGPAIHRMLRCNNASQKAPCCLAKWDDEATNHARLHEETAITRFMGRSLMTASPAFSRRPLWDTKWTAEACTDRDLETWATLSLCL